MYFFPPFLLGTNIKCISKTYLGAFAGGGEEEKGGPGRGGGSEQDRHQQKVYIFYLKI